MAVASSPLATAPELAPTADARSVGRVSIAAAHNSARATSAAAGTSKKYFDEDTAPGPNRSLRSFMDTTLIHLQLRIGSSAERPRTSLGIQKRSKSTASFQ